MATIVGSRPFVFLPPVALEWPSFRRLFSSLRRRQVVVELKDCPISQLVAQWNRIAKDKLVEPFGNIQLLKVIDDRCHEELDMTFEIEGTPTKDAAKIAVGALLNISGAQMDN
jgi:hypothetical protein